MTPVVLVQVEYVCMYVCTPGLSHLEMLCVKLLLDAQK